MVARMVFSLLPVLVLAGAPVASNEPPLKNHRVVLSIDDGHWSVYKYVYPLLKKYRMTATLALIANNFTGTKTGYSSGLGLTVARVKEMVDSCAVEVASHTLSHPWLTTLDSATAWHEIYHSRVVLESVLGVPVISFVYPYGNWNHKIKEMVRQAGYLTARAVRSGEVNFWVDPFQLPEFELRRETPLTAVKEHIRRNRTSILLLHRIVPNPKVFTEWPLSDFARLLAWLDSTGVKTVTLAELYYDWRREVVRKMIAEKRLLSPGLSPDSLFKNVHIDKTRTLHPR